MWSSTPRGQGLNSYTIGNHPERANGSTVQLVNLIESEWRITKYARYKKSGSKLSRLLSMQVHIKASFGACPITSQLRWTRLGVIGLAALHVNNISTFSERHVTSSVHTHTFQHFDEHLPTCPTLMKPSCTRPQKRGALPPRNALATIGTGQPLRRRHNEVSPKPQQSHLSLVIWEPSRNKVEEYAQS